MRKPKIRWSGVFSAAVTVAGILSSPAVLAIVGVKAAAIITGVGAVCQAITKPPVRKEYER